MDWIGLCSVLRPCQHSIGYMGDGFTGQKTQPTVSKYWRKICKGKSDNANKIHTCIHNNRQKRIQIYITTSPLVYTNMGWLWDSSHRGQVRQAWSAVGPLPLYPHSDVVQIFVLVDNVCISGSGSNSTSKSNNQVLFFQSFKLISWLLQNNVPLGQTRAWL